MGTHPALHAGTSAHCGSTGVGGDMTDTAVLLTSELVATAVRHARPGPVRLCVDGEPRRVQVQVSDSSDTVPVVGALDGAATSGRGLAMVQALASRWGVTVARPGKVVWFVLDER